MRTLLKGIAYVYLTYLTLCLLVVLPALNILAPILVRDALDRELRAELLLFNPFTLAADLRGVSLTESDGHEPLAFQRVLADLSLESLWKPGIVLDRFWIDELDVHVLRYESGAFHFEDLLTESEDEPEESAGELPALTVKDVSIAAHTLAFTDRTRPGPFQTIQKDLGIRTRNLSTVPDRRGEGYLELTGDGGGLVRWEGNMDIAGSHSEGRLTLERIDLTHLWRYEAERLAFEAQSARLDLALTYAARWSDDVDVTVSDGSLRLHAVDIVPADPQRFPGTHARLEDLAIDGVAMNLAETRLDIQRVGLRGLALAGYDEADEISLRDIFLPDDTAGGTPGGTTNVPEEIEAEAGDAEAEWQINLAEFSLDDSEVEWRTPYLQPDRVRVQPLRVGARNLRWPATQGSPVELELAINDTARLTVDGEIDIGSGAGSGRVEFSGWQLAWLHPLLHDQLRTDLRSGSLALETAFTLEDFAPATVDLDLRIIDLATVLHETGEEAFTLKQLTVQGAAIDIPAQDVRVALLSLERPTGSLQIRENGEINVNGIVRSTETTDDDAGTAPVDDSASEEAEAPPAQDKDWRVVLEQILLADGRLDFADDSLPLPFSARIENIEAEVRDIDTASESPLSVTLNGNVDGYAPVVIEGSGTPLAERRDGELRFNFRGVDIATMSPYSGTYAGYTIDSGTLSLDLRYALSGQQLDGDNHIVISQMELGEPVESDLAVAVPLKLGLALLTDSKGVIDLSVPVSGDVSDPSFSLGKIIGRAVTNVITKAVTAPFKLLAGLVGSEADLENIPFPAGSAELDAASREAVDTLGKALTKRPKLNLRVVGSADPQVDAAALKAAQLKTRLIDEGLSTQDIETRSDAYRAAVEARFAALTSGGEGEAEAAEEKEEAVQEEEMPDLEAQWQTLVEAEVLPQGALEDLGSERAAAAKRELVTVVGIDASRISIRYGAELGTAGVQMSVDT